MDIRVERLEELLRIPDVWYPPTLLNDAVSRPGPVHKDISGAATAGLSRKIKPHQCILDLVVFEFGTEILGVIHASAFEMDCAGADVFEQEPCAAGSVDAEESGLSLS